MEYFLKYINFLLLRVSFVHICITICPVLVVLGSALLLGSLGYG